MITLFSFSANIIFAQKICSEYKGKGCIIKLLEDNKFEYIYISTGRDSVDYKGDWIMETKFIRLNPTNSNIPKSKLAIKKNGAILILKEDERDWSECVRFSCNTY